jgi:hypothetical protein
VASAEGKEDAGTAEAERRPAVPRMAD